MNWKRIPTCSSILLSSFDKPNQHVIRDGCIRSSHAVSKLAAVLVVLYERAGELRVLLTTRSKALRSHPGQTALPGKVDEADGDFVQTAVSTFDPL